MERQNRTGTSASVKLLEVNKSLSECKIVQTHSLCIVCNCLTARSEQKLIERQNCTGSSAIVKLLEVNKSLRKCKIVQAHSL